VVWVTRPLCVAWVRVVTWVFVTDVTGFSVTVVVTCPVCVENVWEVFWVIDPELVCVVFTVTGV
jgi:hypothetical protein